MVVFITTAAVFFADPGPAWHGDALVQDVSTPIMDEGDGGGDGDGDGDDDNGGDGDGCSERW